MNYLKEGNTLTTYKAVRNLGILSPAARICELIHIHNAPIKKRKIHTRSKKLITQYYL